MTYKAILFDLDNTLVDFSAAEKYGLHTVYATYFKNHLSFHEFEHDYHLINKPLWQLLEQKQISVSRLNTERFRLLAEKIKTRLDYIAVSALYEQSLGYASHWYPGIEQTLQVLKKNYLLGIVTNGLAKVKQAQWIRLEIEQICNCYLVSETLGIAKPEKEIFTLALQQLNKTAGEVLMVGDSLSSDYQGAINAGLDFCWVNRGAQLLAPEFPQPKYTVKSVVELPQILSSHLPSALSFTENPLELAL